MQNLIAVCHTLNFVALGETILNEYTIYHQTCTRYICKNCEFFEFFKSLPELHSPLADFGKSV